MKGPRSTSASPRWPAMARVDERQVGRLALGRTHLHVARRQLAIRLGLLSTLLCPHFKRARKSAFSPSSGCERQMGTTWSARQDMRIRHVPPAEPPLARVVSVDEYRDL